MNTMELFAVFIESFTSICIVIILNWLILINCIYCWSFPFSACNFLYADVQLIMYFWLHNMREKSMITSSNSMFIVLSKYKYTNKNIWIYTKFSLYFILDSFSQRMDLVVNTSDEIKKKSFCLNPKPLVRDGWAINLNISKQLIL